MKRDYLACFDEWKKRWHKCILSGGDYFKEDEIGLDQWSAAAYLVSIGKCSAHPLLAHV